MASTSLPAPLVEKDIDFSGALALWVGRWSRMLDNIVYAAAIPESLGFVTMLGGSVAMSGWVISIQKMGGSVGGALFFVALRSCPDIWRAYARILYALLALGNLVGAVMYAAVACIASGAVEPDTESCQRLLMMLMVARFCGGCASGVRASLYSTHTARFNAKKERQSELARMTFLNMLGQGLGPLVAASVKIVANRQHNDYLPVGLLVFCLSLCQLAMSLRLRSLATCRDRGDEDEGRSLPRGSESGDVHRRLVLLLRCSIVLVLRPLATSSLAAASVMLLETEYSLSVGRAGLLVGLTFLSCIPLQCAFDRLRTRGSTGQLIRRLTSAAVLGSMLLVPFWNSAGAAAWPSPMRNFVAGCTLLLSDAIVFPALFFVDGLVKGIALDRPLPTGHFLDSRGVTFLFLLLGDGIGNPLGPPLARYRLSHGGQFDYSMQQLVLCAFVALVSWVGLLPLAES